MCFASARSNSEILVAGWQGTMFVIDVNKGEIIKRVSQAVVSADAGTLTMLYQGADHSPLHDHEDFYLVHMRCHEDGER